MELREGTIRSTCAEDPSVGVTRRVVEEVLIGKDTSPRTASIDAEWRRGIVVEKVSISASTEEELAGEDTIEERQMSADSQTKAAIEYKGYQALVDRAVDVFGDELIASRWLSMPSADLNGDVPLQVAQELGYKASRVQQIFEPIFVRIEHGIYS